jgi:hypothetical protein
MHIAVDSRLIEFGQNNYFLQSTLVVKNTYSVFENVIPASLISTFSCCISVVKKMQKKCNNCAEGLIIFHFL